MKLNNKEYKFPYWGPLVLDFDLEDEIISLLLEKGKENHKEHLDARKKLVAVIDKAYYYEEIEWVYPLFSPYVNTYIDAVSGYKTNAFNNQNLPTEWKLDGLWINYQQSNEYNPPHSHSGDLSFVIYVQVPEEILEENEKTNHKHNNPGPGMITFDLGPEMQFGISASTMMPRVGRAFMFPAWLPHHVLAFKSDVERISVSGNIIFKYDKNY